MFWLLFFSHRLADPKNIKRTKCSCRSLTSIATVLFPSFHILEIGLMMVTKQYMKHVADLLNGKVVF
jgi:hypothetical protein